MPREIKLDAIKFLEIWKTFIFWEILLILAFAFCLFFVGILLDKKNSDLLSSSVESTGFILMLPIQAWALKLALSKKRKGYRIAIIEN